MFDFIKTLLTEREPHTPYFGGAEGALRALVFAVIIGLVIATLLYLKS